MRSLLLRKQTSQNKSSVAGADIGIKEEAASLKNRATPQKLSILALSRYSNHDASENETFLWLHSEINLTERWYSGYPDI